MEYQQQLSSCFVVIHYLKLSFFYYFYLLFFDLSFALLLFSFSNCVFLFSTASNIITTNNHFIGFIVINVSLYSSSFYLFHHQNIFMGKYLHVFIILILFPCSSSSIFIKFSL